MHGAMLGQEPNEATPEPDQHNTPEPTAAAAAPEPDQRGSPVSTAASAADPPQALYVRGDDDSAGPLPMPSHNQEDAMDTGMGAAGTRYQQSPPTTGQEDSGVAAAGPRYQQATCVLPKGYLQGGTEVWET